MGEIIHFDFKNQRIIEPEKEPESVRESADEIENDGDDKKHTLDFLLFLASGKAKKLMQLAVSPTTLGQSQETVKGYKTSELITWLNNSTENQWKLKAAFYQAIFGELKARLIKKPSDQPDDKK
ncbi:MAG: hypothetical protein COY66_01105 [Candidatus Kerfeldbacteria bacterium CG_4_10_14_0_8_um_filter_42_10]|uniref:Uncharacterized protein n=1 Tax=Candidatus Kerfeldbacteria bacterium CG_4_10_14_0_8_um_filter_42_10 TaxID=2014248 RepID=A0A2M7RKA0_9BACT|nr:MAG: hypothetical protein COY66_01105 [Candidatus Kerfeldbacteria bacterium CG_4_10_14_0_8_um_filter_42_10]